MQKVSEILGEAAQEFANETGYIYCKHISTHPENKSLDAYMLMNASGDEVRYISDEGMGSFEEEEGFEELWEKIVEA